MYHDADTAKTIGGEMATKLNVSQSEQSRTAKPPSDQSEIAYIATRMDTAILRLSTKTSHLCDRLQPVVESRPTPEQTVGGKLERSVYSPIGRGMVDYINRLEEVEGQITRLLDTLAI